MRWNLSTADKEENEQYYKHGITSMEHKYSTKLLGKHLVKTNPSLASFLLSTSCDSFVVRLRGLHSVQYTFFQVHLSPTPWLLTSHLLLLNLQSSSALRRL